MSDENKGDPTYEPVDASYEDPGEESVQLPPLEDSGNPFAPVAADDAHDDSIAAREIAEVQAQLVIALRYPRDRYAATALILEECKRYSFAAEALYKYERGGKKIVDGNVHLALMIAQNWKHLDYGVKEVDRGNGASLVIAWCWDLQTNSRQRRQMVVPHEYKADGRIKKLTDPREIYENNQNNGSRRMRACIKGCVPQDVWRRAVAQVRQTIAIGPKDKDGKPIQTMAERIQTIVSAFKTAGVSVEMLEKRLGHKIDLTTGEDIVDLQAVYNSLREGAKRSEFFDFEEAPTEGNAADLSAALHNK